MDVLIELVPVLLFVAAFKMYDIFIATAVLMVAISVQMVVSYFLQGKKLKKMQVVTWVLVIVFGAMTVLLRDQRFIQWKPTIMHMALALVLAGGLFFNRNFLQMLLGNALEMAAPAWRTLTWMWAAYMALYAVLNSYIVLLYSLESWMYFKIWGYGVLVAFLVVQGVFVYKHATLPEENNTNTEEG